MKDSLTLEQTAKRLNISTITCLNWIRAGLLQRDNLTEETIKNLELRINNGEINRLNRRANKSRSTRRTLPNEYAYPQKSFSLIKQIASTLIETNENISEAVCLLAYVFVTAIANDTKRKNTQLAYTLIEDFAYKQNLNSTLIASLQKPIYQLIQLENNDLLGALYQTLLYEGSKSKMGSYYTPYPLIDEMLAQLPASPKNLLDPCCGTGGFLLRALHQKKLSPNKLYGFDKDPNACLLARLNLLWKCPTYTERPHIYCIDTLILEKEKSVLNLPPIHTIATNPPWGAYKNKTYTHQYLPTVHESFALFLEFSLAQLAPKGELNFLLPDSFLRVKTHRLIRQLLATQSSILDVNLHRRIFKNVFTKVLSLHIRKEKPTPFHCIKIQEGNKKHTLLQSDMLQATHYALRANLTPQKLEVINHLYTIPHQTLQKKAEWALGTITGNNQAFLRKHPTSQTQAIYNGKTVQPYFLSPTPHHIIYKPEQLQQVARNRLYLRPEKLVYKFISNQLVFAYDNKRSLTLNSANQMVPHLPGYTLKSCLALLNSAVFNFLFKELFATHKVLRNELEQLPFPFLDQTHEQRLAKLVDRAINKEPVQAEIDNEIFKLFHLQKKSIAIVTYSV